MNADPLFNAGTTSRNIPAGDVARQAVASLRGYAYQALATALAWLDIDENGRLFLEVAEDYAAIVGQALCAVQVKDTGGSSSVTLNSVSIRKAVTAFVDLVERNPDVRVDLRFFTTSEIGTENDLADRPGGMPGLEYWKKVGAGADPAPLRTMLESDRFPESVREYSKACDDAALRRDLIRRIRWECGQPDFEMLRQELEARLVVVGRDRFNLPAAETRMLVDHLVYRVLEKSIVNTPEDRCLTRAELYRTIDAATTMSMPRASVDILARLASNLPTSFARGLGHGNSLSTAELSWLVEGTTLPVPRGVIARVAVESAMVDALNTFGASVLVGGSGFGKSTVSRAVAVARADTFSIVEFRNADANETRLRLDMIFARIGGLPSSLLILDDLNRLDDTHVELSLARVIEAARRHDCAVLITCYRAPSSMAMARVNLNHDCVVNVPYFSEEEAHLLVHNNGGDRNRWGRLAYVAGASGHPQLTHAFVIGIAARGWPVESIDNFFKRGLSSGDIDAVRDAARRSLVSSLPEGTRNLLYRLSITIGRFDRSLALTIGEISPPVPQIGECMDQLVGPWIEAVGNDLFLVSPLASSFGNKMLPFDQQQRIHKTIADQMLRKGTIGASDAYAIVGHAIAGKSSKSLTMLAQSVLSADARTLEMLTEHLFLFRAFRTDRPIYPEDRFVSGVLRIAQFKLVAAAGEGHKVSSVAAALFNEVSEMPESESRPPLEVIAIMTVLCTMGVANHLDNWIALLCRFRTMVEDSDFLQELVKKAEDSASIGGSRLFGGLFGIGIADLASVDRLEHIVDELARLDANERALWLTPFHPIVSDYSMFVHGPWTQQPREAFDAADAAMRYERMAEKTRNWGIRSLSLQCSVAQAIMLDEFQNNREGALAVLEEARATEGDDVILGRAIARVYWRHGEHGTALTIFRGIVDQVYSDNPVERALALREAAISATKCDEWSQAEEWFRYAQSAARLAQIDDMNVMAIGLGADSAVAALEAGDVDKALTRLAKAVEALADINPEATLRAAYCHRLIRHAVLWASSRIGASDYKYEIDGQPIVMEAGACSNPEPLPAIRERPLGHIDVAWYLLAEIESVAGRDVRIVATLDDRLTEGSIPAMDVRLRMQTIRNSIDGLDAAEFAVHLAPYVESGVYVSTDVGRLKTTSDMLAPARGQIPALAKNAPFDSVAEQVAKDAIVAYGMHSAMARHSSAMKELETALNDQFAGKFPGKCVFDHWHEKPTALTEHDQTVVTTIKALLRDERISPAGFWIAGADFFEWINQSNFKHLLTARLAAWQRSGWKRISTGERFRLFRPRQTVPRIEEVLTIPADDRSFVAKLLLASVEAVGVSIRPVDRKFIEALGKESA